MEDHVSCGTVKLGLPYLQIQKRGCFGRGGGGGGGIIFH